jgi:choline dehydrogenase-like flavoprotein
MLSTSSPTNVLRSAHKILDRGLRRLGIGELIYKEPEGRLDPAEQLQHLSPDGLHQVGLTRMAENASAGVVDPNCRIFDFHNLFIAGASIFPTSGQAPPTLPAVALAVRLAEHIAKLQGKLPKEKDNFVNNGQSRFFRMSRRKLKGSAWTP